MEERERNNFRLAQSTSIMQRKLIGIEIFTQLEYGRIALEKCTYAPLAWQLSRHNKLNRFAKEGTVELFWVSVHNGIRFQIVDNFVWLGADQLRVDPEPPVRISYTQIKADSRLCEEEDNIEMSIEAKVC